MKRVLAGIATLAVLVAAGAFAGISAGVAEAVPANAPATAGITISPPLNELTLGPGLLQANVSISLKNNTAHNFSAKVTVVDFKALDQYGGISLAQAGKPIAGYGLADWMNLPDGSSVALAPGQATTIPVVIQNRDDLTPGGHYGAVVVTAADTGVGGQNTVGFNQELVSLLYLKKLGGDVYGLQLTSMQAGRSSGSLPPQVTMLFKSTGNVYVVPRGYVQVTDPTGKLVAKGIINTASSPIMQGTSERLITLMQTVADTGRPGRYKLTAYYRYDGAKTFQTKTIYFVRGSWSAQTIGIIIFIGVILLALMYTILHKKWYRLVVGRR